MNSPNAFDDLVRSRLSELHDPMQEAHWQDMRGLLARQRRRRRGLVLLLFGLLIGGGAAYLTMRSDAGTSDVAMLPDEAPYQEEAAPAPPTTADRERATDDVAGPGGYTTDDHDPSTDHAGTNPTQASERGTASRSPGMKRNAPVAHGPGNGETHTPVENVVPAGPVVPTAASGNGVRPGMEPLAEVVPVEGPSSALAIDRVPTLDRLALLPVPADPYGPDPGAPFPPDPMPQVPNTAWAWEIGLHAGLGRTRLYPKDKPGTITHDPGTDGMAGVEVMRMGAHLGFGTGLYKTCFRDEAFMPDRTIYGSELKTVFFLLPVDTTLTTVIDTIVQGGTTYYVTGQLDTTLLVLDSMVDTLVTSETVAGFSRTERLCVVEVPLLLDLHTRVGRWSLGVRGGPTVGMITGATLVRTDGEGNWEREAFSSPTFGYTARGYVRYAITPRLALGVEPALRGLLNDPSPGLGLRPVSYGVVGSLSLRLPAGR